MFNKKKSNIVKTQTATEMEMFTKIEELLRTAEEGVFICKMKDGTLRPVSPKIKPQDIEKIFNTQDLEDEVMMMMFNKKELGTREYSLFLRLFKLVHSRTPSATKHRLQKSYNTTVSFRRGGTLSPDEE